MAPPPDFSSLSSAEKDALIGTLFGPGRCADRGERGAA
jgi:hypothetical protein